MYCILDLLTTYTHDSELQAITAPQLIIRAPSKPVPACGVFTSRSLVTVSNSGGSSTSAPKSSLNGGSLPNASVTTDWVPGWQPFHTNLLVFSSQAEFQLTTVTDSLLQTPVQN
jgi:hypothetical protein